MNDTLKQEAQAHVRRTKRFYKHFSTYLIINVILAALNVFTDPGHWWFYWITLFWGIGIAVNALSTFGINARMNKSWEEKKTQEYINKHNSQDQNNSSQDS